MFNANENQFGDMGNQTARSPERNGSNMARASLVLGVLSLFFILFGVFFAIILGALAILFSFLSRGADPKPERQARYGRIIGCITIVASIVLIIVSVNAVINEYGSLENYVYSYLTTMEETYGLDLGLDARF